MLSKRLQKIADMVKYNALVDVGSDHALLPVYLLKEGRIKRAIATDIAAGPLARGRANAKAHKVDGQIDFVQADGLRWAATSRPYETLVVAGMGGETIMRILQDSPDFGQLLLSPQRDVPAVRRFLHGKEFAIVGETMVHEHGKFYFIIDAKPSKAAKCRPYNDAEYSFGRHLIDTRCSILKRYIQAEIVKHEKINRAEYSEYLDLCKDVLKCIQ